MGRSRPAAVGKLAKGVGESPAGVWGRSANLFWNRHLHELVDSAALTVAVEGFQPMTVAEVVVTVRGAPLLEIVLHPTK